MPPLAQLLVASFEFWPFVVSAVKNAWEVQCNRQYKDLYISCASCAVRGDVIHGALLTSAY